MAIFEGVVCHVVVLECFEAQSEQEAKKNNMRFVILTNELFM